MNKNIIIVILIVIVLAVLGAIVFTQVNGHTDTQINFLSASTLNSGDNVTFELKDAQGNVLANQNLNINYVKDGQSQTFTITTDNEGKGYLELANEEPGVREVTVSFAGDDKYNPSNATQTITINETTYSDSSYQEPSQSSASSQTTTQDTSSSDSSDSSSSSDSKSDLNYDSELNEYYDDNGKIKGGQNDGGSYEDLKNNPQQVDEDGNLV